MLQDEPLVLPAKVPNLLVNGTQVRWPCWLVCLAASWLRAHLPGSNASSRTIGKPPCAYVRNLALALDGHVIAVRFECACMSIWLCAQGIAVGIATKIPPHNLNEVVAALEALVQQPDISKAELLKYTPAPDFPTGKPLPDLPLTQHDAVTHRGVTIHHNAGDARAGHRPTCTCEVVGHIVVRPSSTGCRAAPLCVPAGQTQLPVLATLDH
jgi:hypothetical protein